MRPWGATSRAICQLGVTDPITFWRWCAPNHLGDGRLHFGTLRSEGNGARVSALAKTMHHETTPHNFHEGNCGGVSRDACFWPSSPAPPFPSPSRYQNATIRHQVMPTWHFQVGSSAGLGGDKNFSRPVLQSANSTGRFRHVMRNLQPDTCTHTYIHAYACMHSLLKPYFPSL